MTFTSLLIRTATITRRTQTGTTERYNVPSWDEVTLEGVPYRRQELGASEDLVERQTQQATHELFFLPDVEIDGSDLVTDEEDGVVLEVVGPPALREDSTGPHHWEVQARETDQRAASQGS